MLLWVHATAAETSTCFGTHEKGRLEHGVRLPDEGSNFESYSSIARTLGRTYVHSRVREVVVDAYTGLEQTAPGKKFKYGETGLAEGGEFKPHKTHQNGLSVDFFVPVVDSNGMSVVLPTSPLNKWGYSIEFDERGKYDDYTIDFEALAQHLVALHRASVKHGVGIRRVIFDPKLQPLLLRTVEASYLRANLKLQQQRSWVRHDEHYHVDFTVKCKRLNAKD